MASSGGFIYAIGAEGSPHVKIGKTSGEVVKRVARLQTGYPARLSILAQARIEDDLDRLEKALHQMLESKHIYGEWFAIEVDQGQLEALILRAVQWLAEAHGQKSMHIGERIQRLREERGWTQQELAAKTQIKQPVISRLESQTQQSVSSEALKRLARTLGVTADYLIGMYEDDKDSEQLPTAVEMVGA
jgi:DNA-binding XRE family transcriptional regulator